MSKPIQKGRFQSPQLTDAHHMFLEALEHLGLLDPVIGEEFGFQKSRLHAIWDNCSFGEDVVADDLKLDEAVRILSQLIQSLEERRLQQLRPSTDLSQCVYNPSPEELDLRANDLSLEHAVVDALRPLMS